MILKRQTIYIGQTVTICNQALHKYKILISLQPNQTIENALKMTGIFTQQFADEIGILGASCYSTRKVVSGIEQSQI